MKKRILSALLAFAMVLTLLPTALAASPFADVKEDDWFYDAVVYVKDKGLMIGTDKGFEPYAKTTRASIWAILARIDGVDTTANSGAWYAIAQEWSILTGVSDGSAPNGNITREQLVAMFYRYAAQKGYDISAGEDTGILNYSDAQSVSEYALSAMKWACAVGLIQGSDGKLNPQGTATRAEVAVMLYRFCRMFGDGKQSFTVTFDYNYGNLGVYTTAAVPNGGKVSRPTDPAVAGCVFAGWYTARVGGSLYNFNTAVTGDMTLYARWSVVSVTPGTTTPGATHTHTYGDWKTNWAYAVQNGIQFLQSTRTCSGCSGDESTETSTDTFYIYTLWELACFDRLVERDNRFTGKTVLLMNDLDFEDENAFADNDGWVEDPNDTNKPTLDGFNGIGAGTYLDFGSGVFNGTFNGQNHTISNMTISAEREDVYRAGFFSCLNGDAVVKNLNFDNADVNSKHYAGVVTGYCNLEGNSGAVIENCHVVDSTVTSRPHVTEYNDDGTPKTWDDGDKVGGIVGYLIGTVKDCTVESTTIQGYRDLGGLVGYANDGASVTNSSTENVTIRIDAAHNYKNYTTQDEHDAGLTVGESKIVADQSVTGTGWIEYCPAEGVVQTSDTDGEHQYEISSAAGLTWFAEEVRREASQGGAHSLEGATITLTEDIDLTETGWTTLRYGGADEKKLDKLTIDGNGCKITGLTVPLLDGMENSELTIKNLTIEDANVTVSDGDNNSTGAGILVARACGLTMDNCHVVDSSIDGGMRNGTGVLVGYITNGTSSTISNCTVERCTITNASSAGGIVGFTLASGTISNCTVTDTSITSNKTDEGDTWRVGYIVGTVNGGATLNLNGCSASGGSLTQGQKNKPDNQSDLFGRVVGATVKIGGGDTYTNP